jgi:DNA-binding IscR family transcriptional regulator
VALEGPLLPPEAGRDSLQPENALDLDIVREVWANTREALESHLRGQSLDDLCQNKRRRSGEVMYYI